MKNLIFLLILFPTIFCSGCKKEDLTDTTDITQFSWKLKSITIDGDKTKAQKKDYHGDRITMDDYILKFVSDTIFEFNLSINTVQGEYSIPTFGSITLNSGSLTQVCCDNDFDKKLLPQLLKIKSYQVLSDYLILKGKDCEIELEKEK